MDLFLVVLFWLFAIFELIRQYLKLSNQEKSELREEMKCPIVLVDVFRVLGILFLFTGLIYKDFFTGIGVGMLSISLFATGYLIYDTNRKLSIFSIAASIAFMLLYFGRYLWDIMV